MNPGNKWRVNDGFGSVWVSVNDLAFVDKMASGEERFEPSDVLGVEMRDRQFRDGGSGLVMERSIERALEHASRRLMARICSDSCLPRPSLLWRGTLPVRLY